MLRIWRMSGQELLTGSMDAISDVGDLKASLRSLHGFPKCMQQLLHNGNSLDNSTKLDAPINLQLVLRRPSKEAQRQEAATELVASCAQGDLEAARMLVEAGADKNAEDHEGKPALMLAAENGHMEIVRLLL